MKYTILQNCVCGCMCVFLSSLKETHYEIYYILQNRVCVYARLPGLRKTQHEIHSLAKLCVWLYVCVCLA